MSTSYISISYYCYILCREMWRYLEHINILLNGIVRVMSDLPKAQVESMKVNNNSQLRRRIIRRIDSDTDPEFTKEYKQTLTLHSNIPYVTNANGELIPGVLIYIMEGVLPLIKVWILVI